MLSHFFIDRPIFATVLSIVIVLTGGLALIFLPIAQYPPITPPAVQVAISYPGASAAVVADTVAAPIEQQVNGVENMLYMSSMSGNDGSYSLTVTFELGTDLNTALVMVQNRVTLALPQLPVEVQLQGITIRKKTPDILQVINFVSPKGKYDDIYLSNFAMINVKDELFRVDGVSDVKFLGERDYSIRAWLDPQKLAARSLSAGDVANAIRSQNVEAPFGQVGAPPSALNQPYQMPMSTLGRLSTTEQFREIIVKVGQGPPSVPTPVIQSDQGGMMPSGSAPPGGGAGPGSTGGGASSGGLVSATGASGSGATTGSNANSTPTTVSPPSPDVTSATVGTSSTTGSTSSPAASAIGSATGTNTSSTSSQGNTSGMYGQYPGGSTANGLTPGGMIPGGPTGTSAGIVRLRDVARVELGAQSYTQACTFDGKPSVGLAVFQLPGTNAFDVATRVRKKMEELKARFPEGVEYHIAYDITPFVYESIMDVVWTLLEAIGLVAIVVLLFLQNWRAALIPLIAVPVAIVGTFAVMAALGFSLNNISLFGLVLAIGIVVDDAIVVVENIERWLEQGLARRDAARKAMDEVTGPVIAVALVLCAVFVPCAFISGITGQFFRQFAVTIAVSTLISAFSSITLSPALGAILLRPHGSHRDPLTRALDSVLGWFFRLFNRGFEASTRGYVRAVGWLLRGRVLVLLAYGGLLYLTYFVFNRAPTGFIPQQDQGRVIVNVQLPDAASQQMTNAVLARAVKIARETPGVAHTIAISGVSFLLSANSSNFASIFIILEPFEKRRSPELGAEAIMARLRRAWQQQIKDAEIQVFGAPPIPGLSVAGGFKLMVEDRGGLGLDYLQGASDRLISKLRQNRSLVGVSTQSRSRTPELYMDIDRVKAASLGISLADLNQAFQMYLGSFYVNSFNLFGRYWQVTLQAEGRFRTSTAVVNLIQVRNRYGQMVPLGTLVRFRPQGGPVVVTRYNLYTAIPITGNMRPGVSTGPSITAIEAEARQTLPRSLATEWTELMFMQMRAGNTALYVFGLSVAFVFLALAALYESWALPLAVILVVPLCLLCSVAGVLFSNLAVDVFVQIGLVVLVGLACKNAILIVEFAQQEQLRGRPTAEATLEACRLRLRPILMTSFAFILGVVPLVIATGAGAEMRQSLGTAVFWGMLGVTLFGIFLTPVFFDVIARMGRPRQRHSPLLRWGGMLLLFVTTLVVAWLLLGLSTYFARPLVRSAGAVGLALLVLGIPWGLGLLFRRGNPIPPDRPGPERRHEDGP